MHALQQRIQTSWILALPHPTLLHFRPPDLPVWKPLPPLNIWCVYNEEPQCRFISIVYQSNTEDTSTHHWTTVLTEPQARQCCPLTALKSIPKSQRTASLPQHATPWKEIIFHDVMLMQQALQDTKRHGRNYFKFLFLWKKGKSKTDTVLFQRKAITRTEYCHFFFLALLCSVRSPHFRSRRVPFTHSVAVTGGCPPNWYRNTTAYTSDQYTLKSHFKRSTDLIIVVEMRAKERKICFVLFNQHAFKKDSFKENHSDWVSA